MVLWDGCNFQFGRIIALGFGIVEVFLFLFLEGEGLFSMEGGLDRQVCVHVSKQPAYPTKNGYYMNICTRICFTLCIAFETL